MPSVSLIALTRGYVASVGRVYACGHRPGSGKRGSSVLMHRVILGVTDTAAEEAARAYDAKAMELFGEFARLNFPQSDHGVTAA